MARSHRRLAPKRLRATRTEEVLMTRVQPRTAPLLIAFLVILALLPDAAAPPAWVNVASLGMLAVFGLWMSGQVERTSLPPQAKLIALAYGAIAVSTAMQMTSWHDVLGPVRAGIVLLLIAVLASRLNSSGVQATQRAIVWIAVMESILALEQKIHGALPGWGWLGSRSMTGATFGDNPLWAGGRAPGTMGHGIPLGMLAVTGILLLLIAPQIARPHVRLAGMVVLCAGVAASGSRSPVIVGTVALLITIYSGRGWIAGAAVKVFAPFLVALTLLLVDVRSLSLVDSLSGTASLQNRQDSWGVIPRLQELPIVDQLIGVGWDALDILRARGIAGALFAVDNNFVSLLMMGGLVAVIAMLLLIWKGLSSADSASWACIWLTVGMFLSFDMVAWVFPMALLVVFASAGDTSGAPEAVAAPVRNPETAARN
jgi:hypothetical protein